MSKSESTALSSPHLSISNSFAPRQWFLTKGDNNENDDIALYPDGRTLVSRGEVVGFVRGYVPKLGWLIIGFQENIYNMKYLVAGIILLLLAKS